MVSENMILGVITHVDPIDGECKHDPGSYQPPPPGVVLVEPEYLKDRKVYGHVLAAFRSSTAPAPAICFA